MKPGDLGKSLSDAKTHIIESINKEFIEMTSLSQSPPNYSLVTQLNKLVFANKQKSEKLTQLTQQSDELKKRQKLYQGLDSSINTFRDITELRKKTESELSLTAQLAHMKDSLVKQLGYLRFQTSTTTKDLQSIEKTTSKLTTVKVKACFDLHLSALKQHNSEVSFTKQREKLRQKLMDKKNCLLYTSDAADE